MKNRDFFEGVKIIAMYIPGNERDGYGVSAEHDQIWFGEYDWVDNEKDKKRLEELNWFEDEEAWSCFT